MEHSTLKEKVLRTLEEQTTIDGDYYPLVKIEGLSDLPKGSRIVFTDKLEQDGYIEYNPSGKSSAIITIKGITRLQAIKAEAEKL